MENTYKTIEDIRRDYNNGAYCYSMPIPTKVKENHVFDENLSVKRNREMVAEHNQKVAEMQAEKMRKNAELSQALTNDVVAYLVNTYNMNEAQARILENYVYAEKHSFMGDYFSAIDDIADMVENVLSAR